jgi:hypothetical protein
MTNRTLYWRIIQDEKKKKRKKKKHMVLYLPYVLPSYIYNNESNEKRTKISLCLA